MHAALLRSEYYDGSATTRCPQRASRLPTTPPDTGSARAAPGRFPRSLMSVATGSASSYTPAASPRAAHRSLGPGLPPPKSHRRRERAGQKPRPVQHHKATHPPDSAGRGRLTGLLPLVRFPYAFPSSLAGTSRLVVPARPYIVEAAPDLTPDPGIDLPPASTGHCDDRRRASHPARLHQRLVAHGTSHPR